MSRFHHALRAFAALLCVMIVATTMAASAQAQDATTPADFDALLDRGVQHYQAREYEQAIAAFREAFALRPEPEIVYNIARSYERLARPAEAIAEYERFVAMPGTTSELRTRAHASIRALRAEVAASREEAPEATVTVTPPRPEPEVVRPEPPPPPPSGGSVLGPVGWTMFGVGAVSVGVGVAFGVLTIDRNDAFLRAPPRSEQQIALRDDVKESALVADILLIGGGVIAATGLVLAIVDATSSSGTSSEHAASEGPSVAVLPYAGAESAGVTAFGSF